MHKCNPDKWSKMEVDDFLEKLGVDVSRLDYFFLKRGMNLNEGLVLLFDNKSSMEAELGEQAEVIDVYVVDSQGDIRGANEFNPVGQLTQELNQSPVEGKTTTILEDGFTASEGEEDGAEGECEEDGAGDDEEVGEVDSEDGEDDWQVYLEQGEDDYDGDIDDDYEDEFTDNGQGKNCDGDKGKGRLEAAAGKGKGVGKWKAKVGAVDKGKTKVGDVGAVDKGKAKVGAVGAVDKGKAKVGAVDKGKAMVGDDEERPTFVDSDYDLSDKEEDDIMASQVAGWKYVVYSMRVIGDRDGDDGGTSDDLPSD